MEENILRKISEPLLAWYEEEKRELPWRDKNNAYYTWVSEIMLQQTRVEAVKPYFTRFIQELPDIKALAYCEEKKLLKLWEGLGYYNRVRNMQKAALEVCEKYQGELPADYEALLSLPGIGSYTAGAIASIAYGLPVPAVDGNVFRVVCRLTENGADVSKQSVRRQIEQQVKEIIPAARAGDFNQALMELGAVVCVPNGQARCGECPLEAFCQAKKNDRIQEYPYKAPKKARTIQEKTVLVIQDGEKVVLKKRPEKGLLAGLYEFPNKAGVLDQKTALKEVEKMGLLPLRIQSMEEAKHIFSHVEWRMHGYQIRVEGLERKQKKLIYADKKQVQEKYAIPSAFSAFIKYLNLKEEEEK